MRRSWWLLALVLVPVVLIGAALARGLVPCGAFAVQPACHVAMRPGPTEDTLTMVDVDGTPSSTSTGELLLTTVAVDDQLGFGEWLQASLSSAVDTVPREQLYPEGADRDAVAEQNAALMADSQLAASVAALSELGHEIEGEGARVSALADDVVTDDLEVGDVITAVDGTPVADNRDVVEAVRARTPGDRLVLAVARDDEVRAVELRLGSAPDDPSRAYIGVLLTTELTLPVDVTIDAGVIGGPSAGLMFGLSIVDLLEPEDLTGGLVVAGTGTLDMDGVVGGVGGVRQKVLGATTPHRERQAATVFFVPRSNLDDAVAAPVEREIMLVPVDTLGDALTALAEIRAGREPVEALALAP